MSYLNWFDAASFILPPSVTAGELVFRSGLVVLSCASAGTAIKAAIVAVVVKNLRVMCNTFRFALLVGQRQKQGAGSP